MEHLANVYVEIAEQPMGKGLRFRYISEGRTAGSIQGEFSTPERRTFPSIKVYNYTGQAYAVVSCVTTDKPPRPHPHHLVGTNCVKGVCKVAINVANDPIPFSNIGIQCCTRKDINKNLDERRVMNIDPFNTGYQANVDTIDLTTICLCFQVHINVNGQFFCLQPVVSNPIVDKKVCSELSIYRLSRISGSVRGGDEVFLLCTKVKKEDIKVMFSHTLENGEPWEKEGSFSSTDVHKQYVIVFKTPPYHDTDIKKAVEVSLYLLRPSDNAFGEAKTFTYYPENPDPFGIKAKRKRLAQSNPNPPCFIPEMKPSFSGSLASVIGAQPVSIPRFGVPSGVNDGLGQWSFPHLASLANSQGMPVIKPELPFYQTSQPGFDALGPRSTRPASNPFAMSAIPITVEDASRGINRPIPSSSVYSSSVTKEFNFGHVPLPFRSSSSASALEKLVTGNERMKLENFMNPAESQVKDPFSSGQTSTALMPTHASQSAASSRLGMESLFSGLEDATLLTEFFGDDWLRANLPSEEQRFLTEAMPDLTDLTDDDDLKNFIGDLDFTM